MTSWSGCPRLMTEWMSIDGTDEKAEPDDAVDDVGTLDEDEDDDETED